MLAKKITLLRINHLEPTHKQEFKKLSEIALLEVSNNYLLYPELLNLDPRYKLRVNYYIKFLSRCMIIFLSTHL
jgi:hypothetical protein